ncbi:hypothetical protein PMAYCL1PPCAC_26599, partial [Pristionchus mayeri]
LRSAPRCRAPLRLRRDCLHRDTAGDRNFEQAAQGRHALCDPRDFDAVHHADSRQSELVQLHEGVRKQ